MKEPMKFVKRMMALVAAHVAMMSIQAQTFASSMEANTALKGSWPWSAFLISLKNELTGPLPLILGVMGIVGAAIALFSGNGGDGTRKFILLIFVISIALAAPSLMGMLQTGAVNGFMIP